MRSAATAAVIGACGDWLMQWHEGKQTMVQVHLDRTSRLVAFRSVQAPLVEAGWRFFDRRLVHITGAGCGSACVVRSVPDGSPVPRGILRHPGHVRGQVLASLVGAR